ncbi:NAD(P)-dependent oxidoreductase [bacterium]|nr:NAD(P)-dependent oxidoreductase [bacterium]
MKVMVTGSRGYIGSILVPMLLEKGHDVVGLDSDLFQACTFLGDVADVPTVVKDVRDVTAADLAGCDAVIHLAGLSNDPLGDYDPTLTDRINHIGSVKMAKAAREAGVDRFLFASSCSNYGAAGQDFLDEHAAFNPVTPYGESKVAVEAALNAMAGDDFCPVYLRASTAYGLSPRIRFDLVVNNLTAWAVTTGKVYLKSDGSPWRPIVHVSDIARAYIAAMEAPRVDVFNRAFNVGTTSENYQIRDIAVIVGEVVPDCDVAFAPDAGPDKRNYRVDCNRIHRELPGFKPQWTCRRGVEELYQAYKNVDLSLEDFEGPKYKRIDHVKKLIGQGRLGADLRWTA